MTPTLLGRWQTRALLLLVVGVPVSVPFLFVGPAPLFVLAYVLVQGLVLDVVWDRAQQGRWDHDWPVWQQIRWGFLEGMLAWLAIGVGTCAGVFVPPLFPFFVVAWVLFPFHYGAVWLAIFLVLQGPIRVFFPRWRFRGGRITG